MDHAKAIVYGLVMWAAVFTVALLVFPIRETERPLFESIMPVALVAATLWGASLYFKAVKSRYFYIGLCLGIIWTIESMILDTLLFSWGPMKMTLNDYIKDIGVTYLIILIIPTLVGYVLQKKLP